MLVIKKKQLEVFSNFLMEDFLKQAALRLKEEFPIATAKMSDDELRRMIRKGIDRAAIYKIVERKEVLVYLGCQFRYGEDFDTDPALPWVAKILKVRNLSGSEKIMRLLKH